MLARGLSVEEIERLLAPRWPVKPEVPVKPEASEARPEALVVATAIQSMVKIGEDTKAIAALLTVFLERPSGPHQTAQESNPALLRLQAPGRSEESASAGHLEHERNATQEKRAESVVLADQRRE
jgi:hypothetical protein